MLLAAENKGSDRILIKLQNTVEIEGEDKPALVAETQAMLMVDRREKEAKKGDSDAA